MNWWKKWNAMPLIPRILVGMVIGIVLALGFGSKLRALSIVGDLFIGSLRGVAPLLVLFLVVGALCQHAKGHKTNMKQILVLYIIGTFMAAFVAVVACHLFPLKIPLSSAMVAEMSGAPTGLSEVLEKVLMNIVDNPIHALATANFIGVLFWAVLLGLALRVASNGVKRGVMEVADGLSEMVRWIVNMAPFGIMGIVYKSISAQGLGVLMSYANLLGLLLGSMLFVALVMNPLLVWFNIRQNPYPLVLRCLKDSGITAFFTRSSAANIPVNMELCEDLQLDKDTYSVSIPLGATINMAGASVTIAVLTLCTVHSLPNVQSNFLMNLLLALLSGACACGASGVASGSLLLIPVACSLFGIPIDIAMQAVAVGFVTSVLQDSCETALNSSSDVLFTATAEYRQWRMNGRQLPF